MLLLLPGEIILHIFSYLDYPELAILSKLSDVLARLASDPALHNNRIRIISPARVKHNLFGLGPHGDLLRPSVGDLVQRGVMRGLAIERRWRTGAYFYSHVSVRQYETSLLLARQQASHALSTHLRRRGAAPNPLKNLYQSQVYPDVESSSLSVSRSLLPVMRKLKWSLQRDKLAKMVRDGSGIFGVSNWIERNEAIVHGERVRLAICPDVRKIVGFYEGLDARYILDLYFLQIVHYLHIHGPMSDSAFPVLIEVCVDSVQSALNAVRGGANRLEVCGNLAVGGGTTPSLGLVKAIQSAVDVPTMVMVRPRTGDFLYSDQEIEVMLEDIRIFKQHGVRGVVLGVLTADGRVNVDGTKRLVAEALPLEVCFHRAFDMTRDAAEALWDVMSIKGVSRILTSGHKPTVLESLDTLQALCQSTQKHAEDFPWAPSILPGSGINSDTVGPLLEALVPLGVTEIHLSGGCWVNSGMLHRPAGFGMGVGAYEWNVWVTSEDKVQRVKRLVDVFRPGSSC